MIKLGQEKSRVNSGDYYDEAARNPAIEIGTGIWVNGKVNWNFDNRETILYEEELTMRVTEEKPHSKITMITYHIVNHSSDEKRIKLLSMNYLKTAQSDHFAFISPADNTIFHLAGEKMFMIDGLNESRNKWESTVIPSWIIHSEEIWASLKNGQLKYQPTAKGNPASLLSKTFIIPPGMTQKANSWIICGNDKNELVFLNDALLKNRLAFQKKK
ncbi:hypothetical protein A8F94_04440 [Bacillus sp. FJAT-27225]|uniref:hypothetical protein n=1 Tax=Bacillus sp. FJAT-27225 TaxID=1743144 RepID=UPI00080C2383|nr:hypothetical protein [Bacillus sp. FJAT-27225]OCA91113.1 hypothetical protein A8F94_04440 [Bacillus sp. FJAT-27225]